MRLIESARPLTERILVTFPDGEAPGWGSVFSGLLSQERCWKQVVLAGQGNGDETAPKSEL